MTKKEPPSPSMQVIICMLMAVGIVIITFWAIATEPFGSLLSASGMCADMVVIFVLGVLVGQGLAFKIPERRFIEQLSELDKQRLRECLEPID
jgi:hypothetical protein